jgi:hypothetical protein
MEVIEKTEQILTDVFREKVKTFALLKNDVLLAVLASSTSASMSIRKSSRSFGTTTFIQSAHLILQEILNAFNNFLYFRNFQKFDSF